MFIDVTFPLRFKPLMGDMLIRSLTMGICRSYGAYVFLVLLYLSKNLLCRLPARFACMATFVNDIS